MARIIYSGGGGATPKQIWEYSNRTLTTTIFPFWESIKYELGEITVPADGYYDLYIQPPSGEVWLLNLTGYFIVMDFGRSWEEPYIYYPGDPSGVEWYYISEYGSYGRNDGSTSYLSIQRAGIECCIPLFNDKYLDMGLDNPDAIYESYYDYVFFAYVLPETLLGLSYSSPRRLRPRYPPVKEADQEYDVSPLPEAFRDKVRLVYDKKMRKYRPAVVIREDRHRYSRGMAYAWLDRLREDWPRIIEQPDWGGWKKYIE